MSIEIKKKARIKQLEAQVVSIKEDSNAYYETAVKRGEDLAIALKSLAEVRKELHEANLKLDGIGRIMNPPPKEILKGGYVAVNMGKLLDTIPRHALFNLARQIIVPSIVVKVEALDVVRQNSRLAQSLDVGTQTAHIRYQGTLYSVPRSACNPVNAHADI